LLESSQFKRFRGALLAIQFSAEMKYESGWNSDRKFEELKVLLAGMSLEKLNNIGNCSL
jgi:hypothetical protein